MIDNSELTSSEFKTYSLENFGQLVKISSSLSPNMFPQGVNLPLASRFFSMLYEGIYEGRGMTVRGNPGTPRAVTPSGVLVEHTGVLGANDLGELTVSKDIFEGNLIYSLTKSSQEEFGRYLSLLRSLPVPPGWRIFGNIHSHPILDVLNNLALLATKSPKVGGIPLTWSGQDFRSFMESAKYGSSAFATSTLITQTQISFMIATETTLKALNNPDKELHKALNSHSEFPPYQIYGRYGVVLYGGNHFGARKGETVMERLT